MCPRGGPGGTVLRYWDASAIVPLLADEEGTGLVRPWLSEDPHIVTWGLTRLEVTAAVERRAREGVLSRAGRRRVLDLVGRLGEDWDEVTDLLAVRTKALTVLARHPLRTADAAQLGAALVVAEDDPASLTMVCLDRPLADAAEREGLRILSWPDQDDAG